MSLSSSAIGVMFNPTNFARFPDKRLHNDTSGLTNQYDQASFGAMWTINTMMTYLQAQVPTTYTDSVLQSMTANDMVFAVRSYFYAGSH